MIWAQEPPVPPPTFIESKPSVTLGWDRSPDDVFSNFLYKIYSGSTSLVYTNIQSAGTNTTGTVESLEPGGTYYFAVTAVGTNQLESDFSQEINYTVPLEAPAPPSQVGIRQQVLLGIKIQGSDDLTNWTDVASYGFVVDSDKAKGSFRVILDAQLVPAITW